MAKLSWAMWGEKRRENKRIAPIKNRSLGQETGVAKNGWIILGRTAGGRIGQILDWRVEDRGWVMPARRTL